MVQFSDEYVAVSLILLWAFFVSTSTHWGCGRLFPSKCQ